MYFGLSQPWIGKLDLTNGGYTGGFKCGAAVGTTVSPQYAEGKYRGDNVLKGQKRRFKEANVSLEVTEMPITAVTVMFGHTVTAKEVIYGADDDSNYVGYGFIVQETNDETGTDVFRATFLPKVKFYETEEAYTTNGDNIEFKAPKLEGTASVDNLGNWRYKEEFATEALAIAYLKEKLDIAA